MQYSVRNRATLQVANTTAVTGRVTAKSVKHGFCAKKQSDLSRICALTIFGSVVSLAPMTARAQIPAEIAQLKAQVAALQSEVHVLQHELAAVQSNKALKLGPFVDVRPQPGKRGKRAKYQIRRRKFTARSGNLRDVQAAVNSAVDGDTVIIPNGNWTWTRTLDLTSGITLNGKSVPKSINLYGQSAGGVTITNSMSTTAYDVALIKLLVSKNFHAEIKWLNFVEGTLVNNNTFPFINASFGSPLKTALIHDCNFTVNNGYVKHFVEFPGPGGVIWNCNFTAGNISTNGGYQVAISAQGGDNWASPSTMGALDTTGMANTYVEDCTFTNILYATDWSDGAKGVTRYCKFNQAQIGSHGQDSSYAGLRHMEVYNCTFTGTVFGTNLTLRGATAVIYNNHFGGGTVSLQCLPLTRSFAATNCSVTSYPIPRQVGQGWNGATPFYTNYTDWANANGGGHPLSGSGSYAYFQLTSDGNGNVPDPVYLWGNDMNASVTNDTIDECGHGLSATTFIVKGRDYIEGTPKPGYVAYSYPHPLRGGNPPPPPPPPPPHVGTALQVVGKTAITLSASMLKQPPCAITGTATLRAFLGKH